MKKGKQNLYVKIQLFFPALMCCKEKRTSEVNISVSALDCVPSTVYGLCQMILEPEDGRKNWINVEFVVYVMGNFHLSFLLPNHGH